MTNVRSKGEVKIRKNEPQQTKIERDARSNPKVLTFIHKYIKTTGNKKFLNGINISTGQTSKTRIDLGTWVSTPLSDTFKDLSLYLGSVKRYSTVKTGVKTMGYWGKGVTKRNLQRERTNDTVSLSNLRHIVSLLVVQSSYRHGTLLSILYSIG